MTPALVAAARNIKNAAAPSRSSDCRQSPLFQADFCYVEACKPDKKLVQ